MYKKYIKRILDIVFSILIMILLLPLFIIVGIMCLIITGKIIYRQKRDGLNKESYVIYKFSSIKPNGKYSKILNIVRSFGLDELPQLINVLKGDMSIIGPRPFITGEKLPIMPKDDAYTVRPGMISLATANGRRYISHKKRLEYDKEYIKKVSFKLDLYIFFKTMGVLFKQNIKGDCDGQKI